MATYSTAPYLHSESFTRPNLTLLTPEDIQPKVNTYRPNRSSRKGMKQEVFPFKTQRDIDAMQNYFLLQASKAKTPSKKNDYLRDFLLFSLGINMGYRIGDLLSLHWRTLMVASPEAVDVSPDMVITDSSYNFLEEEKTGKHRQLVFNDDCRRSVRFYLSHITFTPHLDDVLFYATATDHTTPMMVESAIRRIKSAAKAVGLPYNVGTHSLRKTFGYRYYKATNDLTTLQKIFNHSSPGITLAYIGITNEDIYNAYSKVNGAILPTEDLERMMARTGDSQANWFTDVPK